MTKYLTILKVTALWILILGLEASALHLNVFRGCLSGNTFKEAIILLSQLTFMHICNRYTYRVDK
jgi:hypothetical protein